MTDIKWIVTGTPVFNSMEDFVSLCTFLGLPKTFVQGRTKDIKDIYILRRTKKDLDVQEIPECYFENVELQMSKDEKALYSFIFEEARDMVNDIFKSSMSLNAKNMDLLECLLRARQCCIWPQMYYDGVAKKNGTIPELWVGQSKKMDTLFRYHFMYKMFQTL